MGISSVHKDSTSDTVGQPNRAEVDGVVPGDAIQPVLRHHPSKPRMMIAAPVEMIPGEIEAEDTRRGLDDFHAFRNDFLADPVSFDDRDLR
jgi:hypothetical protein